MYFVYILQNTLSKRYYVGATNDLVRRISEHNRGQTKSTKSISGAWILVYQEAFDDISSAHRREIKIKSFKGGNSFKKLVGMPR